MCTESQLSKNIEEVVKCYREVYGRDIVDIVLYGSYARGDYMEGSDIVAVVEGSRKDLQDKLKRVWAVSAELGLANDIIVSPTVIPYDEFEKYKQTLPYYRNIAEDSMKGQLKF